MKSTFVHAKPRRTERGNALALFGLAIAGLATIAGLAARIAPAYTTQQNLQAIANCPPGLPADSLSEIFQQPNCKMLARL